MTEHKKSDSKFSLKDLFIPGVILAGFIVREQYLLAAGIAVVLLLVFIVVFFNHLRILRSLPKIILNKNEETGLMEIDCPHCNQKAEAEVENNLVYFSCSHCGKSNRKTDSSGVASTFFRDTVLENQRELSTRFSFKNIGVGIVIALVLIALFFTISLQFISRDVDKKFEVEQERKELRKINKELQGLEARASALWETCQSSSKDGIPRFVKKDGETEKAFLARRNKRLMTWALMPKDLQRVTDETSEQYKQRFDLWFSNKRETLLKKKQEFDVTDENFGKD